MNIGKLIGRVSSTVRDRLCREPQELYSVKGMSNGELQEVHSLEFTMPALEAIFVELDAKFHKEFFQNQDMSPAEAYSRGRNMIKTAIESAKAERAFRASNKSNKPK